MRRIIYIIIVVMVCIMTTPYIQANDTIPNTINISKVDTLTPEQQQQFLYYFYEAERLILSSQIAQAKPLITFCYLLNPNDATINHYLGHYAREDENPLLMFAFYKRAFELEPNEYWNSYNYILLSTENKKLYHEGIANLESVIQNDARNAGALELLQKAYLSADMYTKALNIQDQLDSIYGYNEASATMRYRIQLATKNINKAIEEIERYLQVDPNNYPFLLQRVSLYFTTNQPYTKQIEACEALLKIDSRNAICLNNLAWLLCIHNVDLTRAEQLSRKAIMTEPSNAVFLDTYAWILYKMGEYESALFYINEAYKKMDEETNKNITRSTKANITKHRKEIKRKCKK